MEYKLIRGIIDDLRFELTGLFEQGFSQNARQEAALRELAAKLCEYGFSEGGRLLAVLCDELAGLRAQLGQNGESAAILLAQLWQYSGHCLRRLELAEASAALAD